MFAPGASACDISRTGSTHVQDARLLCDMARHMRASDVGETTAVGRCVSEVHGNKYNILEIYVFSARKSVLTCHGAPWPTGTAVKGDVQSACTPCHRPPFTSYMVVTSPASQAASAPTTGTLPHLLLQGEVGFREAVANAWHACNAVHAEKRKEKEDRSGKMASLNATNRRGMGRLADGTPRQSAAPLSC